MIRASLPHSRFHVHQVLPLPRNALERNTQRIGGVRALRTSNAKSGSRAALWAVTTLADVL